jgi:hypothetical protein
MLLRIAALALVMTPIAEVMPQDASPPTSAFVGPWWNSASSVSSVTSQVRSFFGNTEGRYLANGGTIDAQFEAVLFSKHELSLDLKDGDTLLSSSLDADPSVRSALLVGPDGTIKAAGLLHHTCVATNGGSDACDAASEVTLTIFVPVYSSDDQVQNMFVISKVRDWAIRAVRHSKAESNDVSVKLKIRVRELNPTRNV